MASANLRIAAAFVAWPALTAGASDSDLGLGLRYALLTVSLPLEGESSSTA